MKPVNSRRPSRNRRSVNFYLAVLFAVQATFLVGAIGLATFNDFRGARAEATGQASADAHTAAARIDAAVSNARAGLASEAALPRYAAVLADPASCALRWSGADVFTEGAFHILRGDGSIACSSEREAGGIAGPGYGGSPWLAKLAGAREPIVEGPIVDPLSRRSAVIIAAPLVHTRGTLVFSLDLGSLGSGLAAETRTGALPTSFFVTAEDESTEVTRSPVEGDRAISGETARSEILGWRVSAAVSSSDAFAGAWRSLRQHVLLATLILSSLLLIALTIDRRIARPMRTLAGAVEEAADAGSGTPVPEAGPKEIFKLGRRFNRMIRERAEDDIGLVEMFAAERRNAPRRLVDRMKSAFLMAISHELRTPLTVVNGYASMLQENYDSLSDDDRLDFVRRIAAAGERLEKLLLDVLDVERLSRGVLEVRRRATHVRTLVERMVEITNTVGKVQVKVPKSLVANIDPSFTERMVENLITNAIKYTPAGTRIWVRAERREGTLVLAVDDAGPGVPDDLKEDIFEPFRRGDQMEHASGTGVGLALVSQFARLHGGRAWVEDRRGGGASFCVSFADAEVKNEAVEQAS